jgi:hypothetical protein
VLRGRIEAPGQALANWRLEVEEVDSTSLFQRQATTDAEGRFDVVECPDAPLRVTLHRPHGGTWPAAVVENVRATHGEVVIHADPALEPSVHIRGRILDPDGVPLGGVQVLPCLAGFNRCPIVTTEAETGRFELGPYPPGEWVLRFWLGFADFATERRTLGPNETWDVGDVLVQHGGQVVATLRREEGLEARSCFMTLESETGASEWMQLEGDVARSRALAPGHYRLVAGGQYAGLTVQELDVRSDAETCVEVVLVRGIGVKVSFVDATERALDHALTFELFAGETLPGPARSAPRVRADRVVGLPRAGHLPLHGERRRTTHGQP